MRYSDITASILAFMALGAQASPCPSLDITPAQVEAKADWIVDGEVESIRGTGTYQDCENLPSPQGITHYCGDVPYPEIVTLAKVRVVKSELPSSNAGTVEISRKFSCFSGEMSVMNSKPELKLVGHTVRFFGDNHAWGRTKPGYFWVERLDK